MDKVDFLLISLAVVDGTLTNYHLQHIYAADYQLHLAADRAREPLREYSDRVQERIRIRFAGAPMNAREIADESAELIVVKPTERDIVAACENTQTVIEEINMGKGTENILGDIAEHLDFVISLFSKPKGGE